MKAKEFFKPTWGKIVITLVIFGFFVLFMASMRVYCEACNPDLPKACFQDYSDLIPFKNQTCSCGCLGFGTLIIQYIFNIILPFVFSYFVSCFIISIIKSIRGKK